MKLKLKLKSKHHPNAKTHEPKDGLLLPLLLIALFMCVSLPAPLWIGAIWWFGLFGSNTNMTISIIGGICHLASVYLVIQQLINIHERRKFNRRIREQDEMEHGYDWERKIK